MSKPTKPTTVRLSDLKVTFNVRKELDEDRVVQFAMLMEAGTDFPPILVTPDNEIIDGRTRFEAYKLLSKPPEMVKVIIDREEDRVSVIATAVTANLGGSKPPTQADLRFAVEQMILSGASRKRITESLESVYLPAKVLRKLHDDAVSTIRKRSIDRALNDVASGVISLVDAAATHNIPVEDLKEAIHGKKKKVKSSDLRSVKGKLSVIYKSYGHTVSCKIRNILEVWEAGQQSDGYVDEVLSHLEYLAHRHSNIVADYRVRYENHKRARLEGRPIVEEE